MVAGEGTSWHCKYFLWSMMVELNPRKYIAYKVHISRMLVLVGHHWHGVKRLINGT